MKWYAIVNVVFLSITPAAVFINVPPFFFKKNQYQAFSGYDLMAAFSYFKSCFLDMNLVVCVSHNCLAF